MPQRAAFLPALTPRMQILLDGQRRKDGAILGDIADAPVRDLERLEAGDGFVLEDDRAVRRHVAHDRLQRGRAADAVAAENADDLAVADVKRDAAQDVALAVIGMQIA